MKTLRQNSKKLFVVTVCCMTILSFVCVFLAGCNGGSNAFEGSWKTNPSESANIQNNEAINNIKKNLGIEDSQFNKNAANEAFSMSLKLESGGKVTFTLFGMNQEGTWKSQSDTEAQLTIGSITADAKFDNNKMIVSYGKAELTFYKEN